ENFGPTVHEVFQQRKVDCRTVVGEGLGGSDDEPVKAAAVAEDRILVTLDRDFFEWPRLSARANSRRCGGSPGPPSIAAIAGQRAGFFPDGLRKESDPREIMDR